MIKKTLLTVVLPLVLVLLPAGQVRSQDQSLRIAAVVNDDVISIYDLVTRINLVILSSGIQDSPQARQKLAPEILRRLIDERIQTQEAKKLGITITQTDINFAIKQIEEGNNMAPGGMQKTLESVGLPYSVLVEKIEAQMAWAKVLQRTQRPRIKISEEEIDEVLTSMIEAEGKSEYNFSEIFLPITSPEMEPEISLLTGRMIQQIRAGASFEQMAKNFSQSASAAVGGEVGWVRQGQIDSELEKALSVLEPGQISEPIKTLTGYYLIKLNEKRIGKGLELADANINIQQVFVPLPTNPDLAAITTVQTKAKDLGLKADSCEKMEELGVGINSPLSGNLGTVKISQLSPAIRNAVQDLPVFQASEPVRTKDGFIVLMVCERDENASRTEQRNKIRQMLIQEDLETAGRRYLRNLKRAAFIDVRL